MIAKPPLLIPHRGCVLVADGRKALVLRNEGYRSTRIFRSRKRLKHRPTRRPGAGHRPSRVRVDKHHSAIAQDRST